MRATRVLVLIVGVLALLIGLLWIGQGMGLIMWPASSFMLAQGEWAMRGALLAVLGLVAIWWSRRR
jgi:hypothetical protein